MYYSNIFNSKNKLDGPFIFKYKKRNRFERPCYIIMGFVSNITVVYCPAITIGNEMFCSEFNLAKEIDNSIFISWGKDNYKN